MWAQWLRYFKNQTYFSSRGIMIESSKILKLIFKLHLSYSPLIISKSRLLRGLFQCGLINLNFVNCEIFTMNVVVAFWYLTLRRNSWGFSNPYFDMKFNVFYFYFQYKIFTLKQSFGEGAPGFQICNQENLTTHFKTSNLVLTVT